jgi:two-component system chemotaxis sensor kinase CheA
MVPLKQTFQKMLRLVRDTSEKTGKKSKLNISGEDTEIDKTLIDKLSDPLVHLIRNAVDHGIGTPEERKGSGKSEEGTIDLKAFQKGGNVIIEVADDGKGVDRERILQKAISKGIAQEDRDYSEKEIYDFIMAPGFSTKEVATDISGRGVGMDVVRKNIEKLGGKVSITTTLGQGTVFSISLPLTMAIVDGMVIQVGDERFVLPTLSIEESIKPQKEMIKTVKNKGEMLLLRNELISLIRLDRIFHNSKEAYNIEDKIIIVLNDSGKKIGAVTDSLIDQQQVVIKNLGEHLRKIKGISGGCILGDGKVALIIDVSGLVNFSENN